MQTETLETPVALFVFNRPDTTRRVFEAVASARPRRLLLIADGPRAGRDGETEACAQVREIVSRLDWPCEVSTNFADANLGCDPRIVSGLDWVFSLVEEAIILEDDCLPDPSFFRFCAEMLEKYRGDSRVAAISGTNLVEKFVKTEDSYFFSLLGGNWGWASWRSQWRRFDALLEQWPVVKLNQMLAEVFASPREVEFWTEVFDKAYASQGKCPWDYRWFYTRLTNNALTIVPRTNLVANIGFGEGATHTSYADRRFLPKLSSLNFPLRHPVSFIPLRGIDRRLQALFTPPIHQRISGKIRRLTGSDGR